MRWIFETIPTPATTTNQHDRQIYLHICIYEVFSISLSLSGSLLLPQFNFTRQWRISQNSLVRLTPMNSFSKCVFLCWFFFLHYVIIWWSVIVFGQERGLREWQSASVNFHCICAFSLSSLYGWSKWISRLVITISNSALQFRWATMRWAFRSHSLSQSNIHFFFFSSFSVQCRRDIDKMRLMWLFEG